MEMLNCDKHGEYEKKVITILGTEIIKQCPKCVDEANLHEAQLQAQRDKEAREQALKSKLDSANVPLRYRAQLVDPINEAQKKALDWNFRSNLFFLGGVGTGKTLIASTLAIQAIMRDLTAKMIYTSEVNEIAKSAWKKDSWKTETQLLEELAWVDVLVLDEVARAGYSDYLFRLIDMRYQNQKPTILIANIGKGEIRPLLGDAISDRLIQDIKVIDFRSDSLRAGKKNI